MGSGTRLSKSMGSTEPMEPMLTQSLQPSQENFDDIHKRNFGSPLRTHLKWAVDNPLRRAINNPLRRVFGDPLR